MFTGGMERKNTSTTFTAALQNSVKKFKLDNLSVLNNL